MKIIFDQNISFRVVVKVSKNFPEASQVRQLGLENMSDLEIWNYARAYEFTIVSFDADFYEISNIKGYPPKIIWLRLGNTSTSHIAEIINQKAALIQSFIKSKEYSDYACLEIR